MLTFKELSDKFLVWSKDHQAERSWEWYGNYLKGFCKYPGIADLSAIDLKPYQIQEWIDSHGEAWGGNYQSGAIVAVKRVFNWGLDMGYVDINPVTRLRRPQFTSRKIYMKPEDYTGILSHIHETDPFRDILKFVWITGCRPQESRHIEPRHINFEKGYVLFPKEESKGKRVQRKILLNAEAAEILKRNMANRTEGKVFLNTRKQPWSKFALCNRMQRLSEIIGKRMFMYAARHGYATRKLKAKHGHLEIAATMGHTDGTMLAKVYSHIDEEDEHLRTILDD